ncbi:hypothetical protein [Candidatus Phytoplasma citri]|uniref:tRNA pseudouridine(55) synthase n=1 Tax=Candidatus Phytoplasma citri TaxID=180978 RepID=A0ABU8ZQH8_9MOLU|nr:hypothetical protein [Candidatus Phytoplasma aurantifolia]MDO8060342.1 hypothetical protein [Candidatus Phytoplasma aurantifolia]MDO8079078.1 hypothetical protein [Candidatus Phytoplasma aurantifolia]
MNLSVSLDPLAEGLLIVIINKATKLAFLFNDLDKQYQGTAIFNKNYDTLDVNGKLMDTKNIILSESTIKQNFDFFDNKQYWQTPPIFSAIKIKGQKMYNLARKQKYLEIPPRKVTISNLKLISYDNKEQEAKFQVNVSKGTYIRSLIRDIGKNMNTYGGAPKMPKFPAI